MRLANLDGVGEPMDETQQEKEQEFAQQQEFAKQQELALQRHFEKLDQKNALRQAEMDKIDAAIERNRTLAKMHQKVHLANTEFIGSVLPLLLNANETISAYSKLFGAALPLIGEDYSDDDTLTVGEVRELLGKLGQETMPLMKEYDKLYREMFDKLSKMREAIAEQEANHVDMELGAGSSRLKRFMDENAAEIPDFVHEYVNEWLHTPAVRRG